MRKIKPGDYIVFMAACRYSNEKARRKVQTVEGGLVTVRYAGYSNFYVKPHEIIEVQKQ